MKLLDILPVGKWIELEKEINKRSDLNASVFNAEGIRITDFKKWANGLCPAVKANEKGQSYICAVAHQNAANQAKKTREPVVIECDAGLVKVVVPIFVDGDFLGVAGCCGLLLKGSEVDSFLINKTTGIDVGEIENLSDDIATISIAKLESVIKYIEQALESTKHDFRNQRFVMVSKPLVAM
jgi:ligand-binding sensor protein